MKMFRICTSNQRGHPKLQENDYPQNKNGPRCYSCGQNLSHYMGEYCSKGMINGISYFSEDRTVIEKVWWAICIMLSLCCGVWFILRSYEKWENSPVIVSFATKETPIWHVPFPAVTICPYSQISSSTYNYTDHRHRRDRNETLTNEERTKLAYVDIFCRDEYHASQSTQFTNETILKLFDEIRSKFYENAFACKFHTKRYEDCSDLFRPVFTEVGICYASNLMDRTLMFSDRVVHYKNFQKTNVSYDWSIENGFNKSSGVSTYPQRAYRPGNQYALIIKMKVRTNDIDYLCGGASKGFKVFVGHPHIMPRANRQHFVVSLGTLVKTTISPQITTTSEEVKRYHPKQRNCYLSFERPLRYFKIYTQNNCALECETNVTLQQCGCVYYYMPREADTPICGPGSKKCLSRSKSEYLRDEHLKKIDSVREEKSGEEAECGCLPDCTLMDYDVDSTQITWDWRNSYTALKIHQSDVTEKNLDMAKLFVFFKADQFITAERNGLYGSPEFVANVGGLLGLFVGFTALSLVEIIYYFTLRIICNIYMFGKGNWCGKSD